MTDNIKLLYIDLFCGAGGTSTGVEKATFHGDKCAKVIACVNHDANAIASHAANHPDALHFTEDIRTLELSPLVAHTERVRLLNPDAYLVLWASLECTNFSKAKGGMPRDADGSYICVKDVSKREQSSLLELPSGNVIGEAKDMSKQPSKAQ